MTAFVKDIKYDEGASESLVLPQDHKEFILALAGGPSDNVPTASPPNVINLALPKTYMSTAAIISSELFRPQQATVLQYMSK